MQGERMVAMENLSVCNYPDLMSWHRGMGSCDNLTFAIASW